MRFFYNSSDEKFTRLKRIEERHPEIAAEVPPFNQQQVVIKRVHDDWYNTGDKKNWEDFLTALKTNKTWVAGWDDKNAWFNFPLMQNDAVLGDAERLCPKTIAMLRNPEMLGINIAGFALLLPHSKLPTHTDTTGPSYNSVAVNMLLSGSNSHLHVGPDASYAHELGKAVVFNSEYPHCATNNGDTNRVILYIDMKLDHKSS